MHVWQVTSVLYEQILRQHHFLGLNSQAVYYMARIKMQCSPSYLHEEGLLVDMECIGQIHHKTIRHSNQKKEDISTKKQD